MMRPYFLLRVLGERCRRIAEGTNRNNYKASVDQALRSPWLLLVT
jgi:hypothetical protein